MILADLGDVLGSPVWAVLATLLAAIAIGVSIWLSRRNRTRKSLSYEVKITELVSIHQAAKGRIKILFGDEEIEQAHLVEARIENDGNVPVTVEDFQQAISFNLGAGATALTADITETTPEDLAVQVLLNGNKVELQKLLLNPGDGLTIKVFTRNLESVQCHYRIIGVSKMNDAAAQRQRQSQRTFAKRVLAEVFDSGFLFTLGGAAAVAAVLSLFFGGGDNKTESLVKLDKGRELCGDVLRTSDQRIVLQIKDSGKIRALELSEVKSVKDDAC